jgi:D-beta-D-heptose 7-phosphate kinase/D-beta-D-heptose 1-phosphate adenosyltransferase
VNVISFSKIGALASSLRKKKRRIVFTNGCFDIIHAGHIKYLEKAKALGDVLIVGINSDSSVRKIKGPRKPVVRQGDRAAIVAALKPVDYVSIFNDTTPIKLIKAIKPDVLVKGADWRLNSIVGGDFVRSYGGRVKAVSLVKGRSTSNLIRKIVDIFK